MHAAVGTIKIGDIVQPLVTAAAERIEQAHFDVGMLIQQQEHLVVDRREHVVEQKAHAHAAVGGLEQLHDEQQAGRVTFHQEVLGIDGALGTIDQREPDTQRVHAANQRVEA